MVPPGIIENNMHDLLFTQCLETVTRFVERHKLCNTTDMENLQPHQDFDTCANQCGRTKNLGSFFKCACDEKCTVYDDCCADMRTQCPGTYARAKVELEDGQFTFAQSTCTGSTLAVNANMQVGITHPAPNVNGPSTVTQAFGSSTGVSLWNILDNINIFEVVDSQRGVVFKDYLSFASWGVSPHRLAVVPIVATLTCVQAEPDELAQTNLFRLLPACVVTRTQIVPTVFHRSCKSEGRITCICEEFSEIEGNVRDACQDQGRLTHRRLVPHKKLSESDNREMCEVTGGPGGNVEDANPPLTLALPKLTGTHTKEVPITITPMVRSETRSKPGFLFNGKPSTTSNITLGRERASAHPEYLTLSDVPLEFVVDLKEILERRLRCPSFDAQLSQCDLEECVQGALLVTSQTSSLTFKGNMRCVIPSVAVVEITDNSTGVSLCNCLRIANAVASLKVWKVKVKEINQDQCVMRLEGIPYESEAAKSGLYNFSADQLTKPTEARFLGELSVLAVKEILTQQMDKTKHACLEEMVELSQVCFYSLTFDEPREQELADCVTLNPRSSAQRGNKENLVQLNTAVSKTSTNVMCPDTNTEYCMVSLFIFATLSKRLD
ncbi:hypothetical protein ElyMa_002013000 [Elysia marginata]|uniref:SMB domain-containing protein n=1 Tax=Elysia marginata TaxID=1093978 RepID=A0AAV4F5B7_9GAST|nr:hypothetical protein ElyMa_002013000 [Elysia marginata]